jgi:phage gp45-like
VKGVRVSAVVSTTMSKRFWDTGLIKGEEIYKDKGTGLGVRGKRYIVVSCV